MANHADMMIPFMGLSYLYHSYHMNSPSQHENMQLETCILEAKKTYHNCPLFYIARKYPFSKLFSKVTSCVKFGL